VNNIYITCTKQFHKKTDWWQSSSGTVCRKRRLRLFWLLLGF